MAVASRNRIPWGLVVRGWCRSALQVSRVFADQTTRTAGGPLEVRASAIALWE
jgi:hypothetical protein